MGRKVRRKPRWPADTSASLMLLHVAAPMPDHAATELSNQLKIHWEKLCTGVGDAGDWRYLAMAANVCKVRAEAIDPELVAICDTAMQALGNMQGRAKITGKWGVDYASLAAVPALIEFHDELLANSTPLQMHDADIEAERRTKLRHDLASPVMRA